MPEDPTNLERPFHFTPLAKGEFSKCFVDAVGGNLEGEELVARMTELVERDFDTALTMVGEQLRGPFGTPAWNRETARMLVILAENCDPEHGSHGEIVELAGLAMQRATFHDKEVRELGIQAATTVLSRRDSKF